jgi:CubicO group peptidase (beta-lactamase class C family)
VEQVLGRQYHQAMGFILNSPPVVYLGPGPDAFGVHGAGGSLGMADLERGISFSYATAKTHSRMDNGPRARRLVDAVFSV